MREPIWILEGAVLAIHDEQLAEHGGSDGVRDIGLLHSALAKPLNFFAYGDPKPDLFDLAASYAIGIIKNHPFIDGNKRTGYVLCEFFLELNGYEITAAEIEKYPPVIHLADSTWSEAQFADWLRKNAKRV
jgi:death-on-curing protein